MLSVVVAARVSSFTEFVDPARPHRRIPTRRALAAAGAVAVGVLAVLRVAVLAHDLAPTLVETRLAQRAVPGAPLGLGERAAQAQLEVYTRATGATGRYADVLGAGREQAVMACVVLLAALLVVGLRSGMRPLAAALVLALLAVFPPAAEVLATFGPGQLGVAWLAVGGALLVGAGTGRRLLGLAAVAVGVLTAPVLALPVAVLVMGATARRWAPVAGVTASLATGILVLLRLSPGTGVSFPAVTSPVLVAVAAVVVTIGIALPGLRIATVSLLSAVLLATTSWPGADAAVPAVVLGVLVLGGGQVDELVRRLERRPGWRRSGAVVTGAVVALAVAGAMPLVTGLRTAPDAPAPHVALAAWIDTATDPVTTIAAPSAVAAELVRDGVPAERLTPDGRLVVTEGPTVEGTGVARFGDGATALNVTTKDSPTTTVPDMTMRTRAGSQLAANPNLTAPPEVRAALDTGSVDPRALAVLAGLAGRGPVVVHDLPAVPNEDAALPRHRVALGALDDATRVWLAAQRPPFAPVLTDTPDDLLLTWPVPAPTTVLR